MGYRRAGVALAACLACNADGPSWSLAPAGLATVVAADSSHVFELVRVLGPDVLPSEFTYLGPAAISGSGKVALRSHTDCRIAVLDLTSGALERLFGGCGDGPHETRTIAAMLWQGDTVVVVDAMSGRFRWFGPGDTVVRRVQPDAAALGGSSGVHGVAIIDDTTALLFLRVHPASVVTNAQHDLIAEMDLGTGAIRRRYFEEPLSRRKAEPESQRYYNGCAVDQGHVAVENNGPGEVIRLRSDGSVEWARVVATELVGPVASPVGDGASFRWGRLPRPVACGTDAIVSRILPIEGNNAMAEIGRIVAFDWNGRTLINQAVAGADYPIMFSGWDGRDSLFVATVSQAAVPHAAVFKLRPRSPGEVGPFLIPDSVRAMYE